jgi:hypothetical protein
MSGDVKFPDVQVKLTGQDGNIFSVIGTVTRALERAGHADAVAEFIAQVTASDSYHAALSVAMRTVNVS